MTTTLHDIGDLPAVTATFAPDPISPLAVVTAVTVKTIDPNYVTATYTGADAEVTEVEDNVWRFVFPASFDVAGTWYVKFFATAGIIAAEEISLDVKPQRVG